MILGPYKQRQFLQKANAQMGAKMGDQEKEEGLEYEAANFFRLGTLLQKQRSPLKARLVEAVLKEELSTVEKIKNINAIDLKPEEEERPEQTRRTKNTGRIIDEEEQVDSTAQSQNSEDPVAKAEMNPARRKALVEKLTGRPVSTRNEQEEVRRSRLRYSKMPEAGGILHYLFGDYRLIRNFGFRTGTIEKAGFPFILHLTPAIPAYFNQTLVKEIATGLIQGLAPLLRRGWIALEKEDYNLLAGLRLLVDQIVAVELRPLRTEMTAHLASFSAVSTILFVLCGHRETVERTVRIWGIANEKLAISDPIRARGPLLIKQLLNTEAEGISLFNIIRAMWMLKTLRMVDFADMVPKHHGILFGRDSYDCTTEVQDEIDRYIQNLIAKVDSLNRERTDIDRLRYFLPRSPNSELFVGGLSLDFGHLDTFYNGSLKHPEYNHLVDRDNRLVWVIRFLDVFLENIGPLLGTGLRLQALGPIEIFQKGVLSSYSVRLSAMQDILKRYPLTARAPEPKAVADIEETARILTSLGKTVIDLIRNRSTLADPVCRTNSSADPSYPIPSEGDLIGFPEMLAGKTVIEALIMASRVCLQAGFFLGDYDLASQLERENKIRVQAVEYHEKLKQLTQTEQMADIEMTYGSLWKDSVF